MLKFMEETLIGWRRRISRPTIGNLEVESIVRAKTSRNGRTKIGCGSNSSGSKLKVLKEVFAVHARAGGKNAVAPKAPDKTMKHIC